MPRVRKDFGEPPLVTPSSQIVGTQAVFNVLMGERYKMATKETKRRIMLVNMEQTVKPFNPKKFRRKYSETMQKIDHMPSGRSDSEPELR